MGGIMFIVGNWLKSFFKDKKTTEGTRKPDLRALKSFEYLIDRGVVIIDGRIIYIYKNIWDYYPDSKNYWRKCACMYLNSMEKEAGFLTVHFKDMETGEDLDSFDCKGGNEV